MTRSVSRSFAMATFSAVRRRGSSVVPFSSSAVISPSPLKRMTLGLALPLPFSLMIRSRSLSSSAQ